MSDVTKPKPDEPSENQLTRLKAEVDWNAYGKMSAGAVIGLVLNAGAIMTFAGGDLNGLAEGVVYLTPALIIAAALFHRYNPVEYRYVGPLILFATVAAANTVSVIVRIFRMGPQSNPLMSAVILFIVALMFTPGPFLGIYAARRWWM